MNWKQKNAQCVLAHQNPTNFLGSMHALLLLLGYLLNTTVISSTTSEPDDFLSQLDEEYNEDMSISTTNVEPEVQQTATTTDTPAPISVYRRWLYHLLGIAVSTEAPPAAEFEETFSQCDEWVLINKITREDPVFTDMWDPAASGDWSVLSMTRLPPVSVPAESEDDIGQPEIDTHDLTNPEGLFRWAFSTSVQDDADREIERMSVWKRVIATSYNPSLPSFLDGVVSPIEDSIVDAIYLDIDRTRPEHLRPRMAKILMAYAFRNPAVGFCQGMTYLVSALLQQTWMSDEEVFMGLSVLVENINTNYYDNSLSGIRQDLRRLEILLIQKLPWIPPIPLALVLVEPLMCLFTRIVAIDSSSRILDVAFSQNRIGLFGLYLGLLDVTSPAIQRTQGEVTFEEAMSSINAAVTFREELVRIGSNRTELNNLLQRAEGYLLSFRPSIAELIAATELPEDVQWVISSTSTTTTIRPSTTSLPVPATHRLRMNEMMNRAGSAASRMMASFRDGLVALLDDESDND